MCNGGEVSVNRGPSFDGAQEPQVRRLYDGQIKEYSQALRPYIADRGSDVLSVDRP